MNNKDLIDKLTDGGPKRPCQSSHKVVAKWLVLMAVYFSALMAISGFRSDIALKILNPLYLIELSLMLLTTIAAVYGASFLALPDSNQRPWIRFVPLVPLALLLGIICYGLCCSETMPFIECLKSGRYDCIAHVTLYSIVPIVAIFYTVQKAAPIKCCWAGAMAGLSAASFGYIVLRLVSDKSDDPTSLIIWHFLPVVAVVMVSTILGKVIFSRIWK